MSTHPTDDRTNALNVSLASFEPISFLFVDVFYLGFSSNKISFLTAFPFLFPLSNTPPQLLSSDVFVIIYMYVCVYKCIDT